MSTKLAGRSCSWWFVGPLVDDYPPPSPPGSSCRTYTPPIRRSCSRTSSTPHSPLDHRYTSACPAASASDLIIPHRRHPVQVVVRIRHRYAVRVRGRHRRHIPRWIIGIRQRALRRLLLGQPVVIVVDVGG